MARVHPDHRINVAIAYSAIFVVLFTLLYKHPHTEGCSGITHYLWSVVRAIAELPWLYSTLAILYLVP